MLEQTLRHDIRLPRPVALAAGFAPVFSTTRFVLTMVSVAHTTATGRGSLEMLQGLSIVAIIPARGGSKGLPRKNILDLGGRPLIAWTIEAARKSRTVDRIVVSTDDEEIAAVARHWGAEVPFLRPAELARDTSPVELAIIHMLDGLEVAYDYLVLIEPTTPLRHPDDIDGCIERCVSGGAPACISVAEPAQPPYWTVTLDADGRIRPLISEALASKRRQDLPKTYLMTGGTYAAEVAWYRQRRTFVDPLTLGYVMPPERALDIDTELDLLVVRAALGSPPKPA